MSEYCVQQACMKVESSTHTYICAGTLSRLSADATPRSPENSVYAPRMTWDGHPKFIHICNVFEVSR